jgi:hypothetical protein
MTLLRGVPVPSADKFFCLADMRLCTEHKELGSEGRGRRRKEVKVQSPDLPIPKAKPEPVVSKLSLSRFSKAQSRSSYERLWISHGSGNKSEEKRKCNGWQ